MEMEVRKLDHDLASSQDIKAAGRISPRSIVRIAAGGTSNSITWTCQFPFEASVQSRLDGRFHDISSQ